MNFQELIKSKLKNPDIGYEQGALMARGAIIDLLMTINATNLDQDGQPINEACRAEVEAIDNLIILIKHGDFYE